MGHQVDFVFLGKFGSGYIISSFIKFIIIKLGLQTRPKSLKSSLFINMILNKLFEIRGLFSTLVRKQLAWKANPNGVQIYYKDPKYVQNIVFYATLNIKLSQMMTAFEIRQKDVSYPQGVNSQTDLVTFLLERENAKAIQIKHKGEHYVLRNRACNLPTKQIIQTLRDPKCIYKQLLQFTQNNKPKYFMQRINYLTRYYLRLQAQYFVRMKKVKMDELLTSKLKDDLLNFLNFKNQVNSQQLIEQSRKQEAQILESIQETQMKINELMGFYEKRETWYKRMAILITFAHLVSFGYMIFGVEWLGWDIIEPLTYTVGVLYTLLGIRFYRKYRLDRSSKNIKQALFKFIMPPNKRVALEQIKQRLAVQQKQLKRKHQQQLILKNRLGYRTSLINSLQNTIK